MASNNHPSRVVTIIELILFSLVPVGMWAILPTWFAVDFLAGCSYTSRASDALYRLNVRSVAERLKSQSSSDVAPFVPPELPIWWGFGLSGICDSFDDKEAGRYCRHSFPPTQNILAIVEESLQDALRRQDGYSADHERSELVNRTLASWSEAVDKLLPSSNLIEHRNTVYKLAVAAAALAIPPIIFDWAGIVFIVFWDHGRTFLGPLLLFISLLLSVAASECAKRATNIAVSTAEGVVKSVSTGGLEQAKGVVYIRIAVVVIGLFVYMSNNCRQYRAFRWLKQRLGAAHDARRMATLHPGMGRDSLQEESMPEIIGVPDCPDNRTLPNTLGGTTETSVRQGGDGSQD